MGDWTGIIRWIANGQRSQDAFLWECPFCSRGATVTQMNRSHDTTPLTIENAHGRRGAISVFVVCPNPRCQEFSLYVFLYEVVEKRGGPRASYLPTTSEPLAAWQLVPASEAKVYPDYVPKPIRDDYTEAYLTRDVSPKASATLARRCLQGMIRDFYGVRTDNLKQEIEAIQDKVAPLTWKAIHSVRSVGNIGAHMEKDINVIVDVEPGEATMLLGLIEHLIEDWYVTRHEREKRLEEIVALKEAKDDARKPRP